MLKEVKDLRRWAKDKSKTVQAAAECTAMAIGTAALYPDEPIFRAVAARHVAALESALRSPVMAGEPSNINGAVSQPSGAST